MKAFSRLVALVLLATILPFSGAPARGAPQPPDPASRLLTPQRTVIGAPIVMSNWADDCMEPAVAYNAQHNDWIVTWVQHVTAAEWEIWAVLVTPQGVHSARQKVRGEANHRMRQPAVAYSPTFDGYAIVYTEDAAVGSDDVGGTMLPWNLGAGGSGQIAGDANDQTDPAIIYNSQDDELLVAYTYHFVALGPYRVVMHRLQGGLPTPTLGPPVTAPCDPGADCRDPGLAYDPAHNRYEVTYRYTAPATNGIRALQATTNLSAFGLPETVVTAPSQWACELPGIVYSRDEHLAVWLCMTHVPTPQSVIQARRLSAGGTPLGPAPGILIAGATPAVDDYGSPGVGYIPGYGYLVTMMFGETVSGDVYGRLVRYGADSALATAFPIDAAAGSQMQPAVACAPDGRCLVVNAHRADGATKYLVRGRFVQLDRAYLPATLNGAP